MSQPTSNMTRSDLPDASIRISIDRGGTFTDVHASWPDPYNPDGARKETITKLLSQDPSNYKDAPTEGIRRILEHVTGQSLPRGKPLPTDKIGELGVSASAKQTPSGSVLRSRPTLCLNGAEPNTPCSSPRASRIYCPSAIKPVHASLICTSKSPRRCTVTSSRSTSALHWSATRPTPSTPQMPSSGMTRASLGPTKGSACITGLAIATLSRV